MIESDGSVSKSHHGQSLSLSLCGLLSMARAHAQVDIGPNCSPLACSLMINSIDFQWYAAIVPFQKSCKTVVMSSYVLPFSSTDDSPCIALRYRRLARYVALLGP